MLWKDVREVRSEIDLVDLDVKKGQRPHIRPIETTVGCQFVVLQATGVPLPQVADGAFKDDYIVKRAVRVAIDF